MGSGSKRPRCHREDRGGGHDTAFAEKALGKATGTAPVDWFGERSRLEIGVDTKRGLKLLPVPSALVKAEAGRHKLWQCRGTAPEAGPPWLGSVPSSPAVLGPCLCGSRARGADTPRGKEAQARSSFVSAS